MQCSYEFMVERHHNTLPPEEPKFDEFGAGVSSFTGRPELAPPSRGLTRAARL